MIIIFCCLIYFVSLAYNWWWTKTAFSKEGIFYGNNISVGWFFFCIAPVANTVAAFVNIFYSPRACSSSWFENFLNKLFRIKK